MKNAFKVLGTQIRRICAIALVAIIGLALAGCPNPGDDENKKPQTEPPQTVTYVSTDSDNTRYTLTITENTNGGRAAYAPKSGDAFVLTVELFNDGNYAVSLTCSGTVQNSSDTALNLQLSVNNAPLTITIANGNMTVISGTLIDDKDGQKQIPINEPKPLTPVIDKTVLQAAIASANTAKSGVAVSANGADVPTTAYWVTQNQMETFTTAIATAQAVYDNENVNQGMVDYAKIVLDTAVTVFNGQKKAGSKTGGSSPQTYNITWVLDGGSWSGTPGATTAEEQELGPGFIMDARISEPDAPIKSGYVFQGWYTENAFQNKCNFPAVVTADLTLYAKWKNINDPFDIGDIGPGGGIVIYVNQAGFTMTDDNSVCHYLEVSPEWILEDGAFFKWASTAFLPPTDPWGNPIGTGDYIDIAGTETEIGTGRKNTALILAIDSQAPAAKACNEYRLNGTGGWFLPSKDELHELYLQRRIVPGLWEYASYWSSTQYDTSDAWCQDFHPDSNGRQLNSPKYNGNLNVFAMRAF